MLAGGCAFSGFESAGGLGVNAEKMDAAMIRASAELLKANREKDTSMRCVRVPTPYGVGVVIEVNMDTAGKMKGDATMAPDCTLTIRHDSSAPPK